jgi:LysM repeat protein
MNQERSARSVAVNRCPNCGTRVAQNAEKCYFCGYDLVNRPKGRRRITWTDILLVGAVLLVVVVWWRLGSQPNQETGEVANFGPTLEIPTPVLPDTPTPMPESTPTPTLSAVPAPADITHTVRAGETLLSISQLYGVTVAELQSANNLTGELIRAGDVLIIPVEQAQSEGAAGASVPSVFNYTVRSGDTVVSIAVRFGTTIEAIQEINNLGPNDFIRPDQVLLIPVNQVPSAVLASSDTVRDNSTSRPADSGLYEAPRLMGPQDDQIISRQEEVLFRWVSVDILAPNEWYVLRIWPAEGGSESPPTIWTKTTSYRLGMEWAPPPGRSLSYGWQMTVVRVLPDTGSGREIEAASIPSETRTFIWQ